MVSSIPVGKLNLPSSSIGNATLRQLITIKARIREVTKLNVPGLIRPVGAPFCLGDKSSFKNLLILDSRFIYFHFSARWQNLKIQSHRLSGRILKLHWVPLLQQKQK